MDDRIEKRLELKAPVSRVWRALTDYRDFGERFGIKLDGPFVAGRISRGRITHPCGCGQMIWEATAQTIEHERLWKRSQAAHCFSSPNPALAEFPAAGASKHFG
jgi:hypothetical protein